MAAILKLGLKILHATASSQIADNAQLGHGLASSPLLVGNGAAFKGLQLLLPPAGCSISEQGHMLPS
eukprot:835984-Pelagomonas_calceolata.AAC.1